MLERSGSTVVGGPTGCLAGETVVVSTDRQHTKKPAGRGGPWGYRKGLARFREKLGQRGGVAMRGQRADSIEFSVEAVKGGKEGHGAETLLKSKANVASLAHIFNKIQHK